MLVLCFSRAAPAWHERFGRLKTEESALLCRRAEGVLGSHRWLSKRQFSGGCFCYYFLCFVENKSKIGLERVQPSPQFTARLCTAQLVGCVVDGVCLCSLASSLPPCLNRRMWIVWMMCISCGWSSSLWLCGRATGSGWPERWAYTLVWACVRAERSVVVNDQRLCARSRRSDLARCALSIVAALTQICLLLAYA